LLWDWVKPDLLIVDGMFGGCDDGQHDLGQLDAPLRDAGV
jgi:hypothetical protein